jgi:hypothetical protein
MMKPIRYGGFQMRECTVNALQIGRSGTILSNSLIGSLQPVATPITSINT